MSLHPFRSFGSRSAALATAAVIGAGALLANFPAAAQQTALSASQCRDAISISTAIMTKYRGRISEKLAHSFGQFRDSDCDLKTPFTRVEGTADETAFGEFRIRLIALRTAELGRPAILAKQ